MSRHPRTFTDLGYRSSVAAPSSRRSVLTSPSLRDTSRLSGAIASVSTARLPVRGDAASCLGNASCSVVFGTPSSRPARFEGRRGHSLYGPVPASVHLPKVERAILDEKMWLISRNGPNASCLKGAAVALSAPLQDSRSRPDCRHASIALQGTVRDGFGIHDVLT